VSKRGRRPGAKPAKQRPVFVARPFEGLPAEAEWVAMREIVPVATATATLRAPEASDRTVIVATLLPLGWPGLVRPDRTVLVGLQVPARSGDVSRDLAAVLVDALAAEQSQPIAARGLPGPGPRLQDLLADQPFEPVLFDGFGFWLDGQPEPDPEVQASLERANAAVVPTVRMTAAPAAYWCRLPERAHLRWVLQHGEDVSLDALARCYAEDRLTLGDGTRYVGAFRAHGLLAPVWDLPPDADPTTWEEPLDALASRLDEAVAVAEPLNTEQRRARDGLRMRQVTIR